MPIDGMDMTMMLTRAGEVDSLAVIELTAESTLGQEPSGVSAPDIQHPDLVKMGPTPMKTACYCEVSRPGTAHQAYNFDIFRLPVMHSVDTTAPAR